MILQDDREPFKVNRAPKDRVVQKVTKVTKVTKATR